MNASLLRFALLPRLLSSLLLALPFACGSDDAVPATDAGGADAATNADAEGIKGDALQPIPGSLVVHTTNDATVLLGDGSKYSLTADAQGVAAFTDPSIVLPQDVTILQGSPNAPRLVTIVGVTDREIWTEVPYPEPPPGATLQGTLGGSVLGRASASTTGEVFAFGAHFAGQGTFYDTYSVTVDAVAPGNFDVIAYERFEGTSPFASAAGVLRGVPVSGGVNQIDKDITLQPPNETIAVSAQNDAAYGGLDDALLLYSYKGRLLFGKRGVASVGVPQVDLKAFPTTAPFDLFERTYSVRTNNFNKPSDIAKMDPANLFARIEGSLPNGQTSIDAKFLSPGKLTTPAIGKLDDGVKIAASTLPPLAWTCDPASTHVRIALRATEGGAPALESYTLYIPAAAGSYKIPAFAAARLSPRRYLIELEQNATSGTTAPHARFATPDGPTLKTLGEHRTTVQWGFFTLQ